MTGKVTRSTSCASYFNWSFILKCIVLVLTAFLFIFCCSPSRADKKISVSASNPVAKAISNSVAKPSPTSSQPTCLKPQIHKRTVVIDGQIIMFIGGLSKLEVVERQLYLQSKIKETINNLLKGKPKDIKVDIDETTNQFIINDIPIDKVTDVDALVNKTSKHTLLRVWQYNIVDLIKYCKKHQLYKQTPIILKHTVFCLIIFVIIVIIIELLLPKTNKSIHNFVIKSVKASEEKKRRLEMEELASEDREYVPKIEDTPKSIKKKQEQIEELARHTNLIFNIFVRFIQFNLLIVPLFYGLYEYPVTYPYVDSFVNHFMGILIVTSETITESIFDNKSWECTGNALIAIIYAILAIITVKILSGIADNIIYLKFAKRRSREKRFHTINSIISTTLQLIIVGVTIVSVLEAFNINPIPILTSAGLVGVALSIGAQNLIKDVINGFFILIENQFGIGDYIKSDSIEGYVDDMTLRITVLRDKTGTAHIVPNSQINKVSVFTKDWARANVLVSISYDTDIDTAIDVIRNVARQLQADMAGKIIGDPKVLGVEDVTPGNIIIKTQLDVIGGEQWNVERELRRRIKYALDQNQIRPK